MKIRTIIFYLTISITLSINLSAQKISLRQANKNFENLAYAKAIPFYLKVLYTDSTHSESIHKIAECYRQINDYENAVKYFSKTVKLADVKPIEKYYYGQMLMIVGNYTEAKKWLIEFRNQVPNDERADNLINGIKNLDLFLLDSARFNVSNISILNTSNSEFGPCLIGDKIVFSSNKYLLNSFENKHNWTKKDYYHVFEANISDLSISKPVRFSSEVQNKFNDGPVSYDATNDMLYITRNQTDKGKIVKASDQQVKLQIYVYTYNIQKNEWENESSFVFNNKEYNVAHPAVSPDGNTIIFSSDMPGGNGGMDLYICYKNNGVWSAPKNLGDKINTKGNEVFPYISYDNFVFFSSDGLEGIGGLDIYYTTLPEIDNPKPKPLQFPINTQWDDFGLVLNKNSTKAFFASNRTSGKGDDDIFKADILIPFKKIINVELIAKDLSSEEIIPFAEINILDSLGNVYTTVTTDENGKFNFVSETGIDYTVKVNKTGYNQVEIPVTTKNIEKDVSATALLPKPFECMLMGLVTDAQTKKPLDAVNVVITDKKNKIIFNGTTAGGEFSKWIENAKLNDSLSYKVKLSKEGYYPKELSFYAVVPSTGKVQINSSLDLGMIAIVTSGGNCDQIIGMNPIYFDLDKYYIRPDAALELDKVVKFMLDCPDVKIEVRSHTDCRAPIEYNNILSTNRAKSTVEYIVSKGINKNRLFYKGYGELQTLNNCNCEPLNDCDCTEAEHQKNRRSEFIIIK